MKNFLSVMIFVFMVAGTTLFLRAADQPPLNEKLKSFQPYLGNWSMHWTENGQPMAGKATIQTEAGGTIVLFRIEVADKEGKPVYSRLILYYWRGETKSIGQASFDSSGTHWSGILASQTADKSVWQGQGFSPEGKPGTGLMEIVKIDEDTWTAQFVRESHGGVALPDSAKFNFTRAK